MEDTQCGLLEEIDNILGRMQFTGDPSTIERYASAISSLSGAYRNLEYMKENK